MKAHRRCVYAECWAQVWRPRVPNIKVRKSKNPTYLSPPSPLGCPLGLRPGQPSGTEGGCPGGSVCLLPRVTQYHDTPGWESLGREFPNTAWMTPV